MPAWIAFELVITKLPHYVLPLYPALAILIALLLPAVQHAREASRSNACRSNLANLQKAMTMYGDILFEVTDGDAATDLNLLVRLRVDNSQAKLSLGYTIIRAPVDGVVVARNVDIGQTVAASLQAPVLFVIAQDLSKMQVDTNVSESDIGGVAEGKLSSFRDGWRHLRFLLVHSPTHLFILPGAVLAVQESQDGTGHAVRIAWEALDAADLFDRFVTLMESN